MLFNKVICFYSPRCIITPKIYVWLENNIWKEKWCFLCVFTRQGHIDAPENFCRFAWPRLQKRQTNQRTIQVIYRIPAGKLAWFWHSKENVRLCTSRVRDYYWSWSLKLNCANDAPFVSCCYWKFWRTHIPESYENILLQVFYKHICILR